MRVPGDRVGPLDAGQVRTQRVGQQRAAAPGGVDVQRQALGRADIGDGRQRIDRAGGGGPGGGNDEEGRAAVAAVARDALAQRGDVQPLIGVAGHLADRAAAQPGGVGDLHERVVRLVGRVERRAPLQGSQPVLGVAGEVAGQRHQHRGHVGLRAAGGEGAGGALRVEAGALEEPVQRRALHLVGRRRVPPAADLRVVDRGQRVGDDARGVGRRIEEAEVARVRRVQVAARQQIGDVVGDLLERHRRREVVAPQAIDRARPGQLGRHRQHRARALPSAAPRRAAARPIEGC